MRARSAVVLVLPAIVLASAVTAPACTGAESAPAALPDAAADVLAPPPLTRTETEAALAPKRRACAFGAGAWAAQTLGSELRIGEDMPIKHILVIMQENRSFDHYLGRLVAQGYYKADELDGPPPGWSNPDGQGGTVVPHPDDEHCYGVNHGWNDMHDHYAEGRMDRFVTNNNPNGQRSFFYQDDTVIPFYYALASTFAVGDRYFASVMSSTWPNRYYLMAATSFGIGDNAFCTLDTREKPVAQIFSMLEAAGRTWTDYTDGPHQVAFFRGFGWRPEVAQHNRNVRCDLMNDIRNDTLPDVGFIMGEEGRSGDEGPSALPGIGGKWVEDVVRALFASPAWKDTALFITYDENGGTADHVPPADACPPDSLAPRAENGQPLAGGFDKTGFRVPFIVVSPYVRKHFVSHTTYDHSSITRFIEARFGLPAMTARDANAAAPIDMFDFDHPPFLTPPEIKATTTVDPKVLARCGQQMTRMGCD